MKIAIVEDDASYRKSLELFFKDYEQYTIVGFRNAKVALEKLDDSFDLVVSDISMAKMNGLEFIKALDGRFETIVITANPSIKYAIEALRLGVKDFLMKPFEPDTLIEAIERSRIIADFHKKNPVVKPSEDKDKLANISPSLEEAYTLAKRCSPTTASVLLMGESGVGKEVFSNYIHKNSTRANKPFIAINMAAIPESLIESELFGCEKGAYTGADKARAGKFEEANSGTIFLDEIGEMPKDLQSKLLRALQEKEVMRLGGNKPIKVDVRVISATNQNMFKAVQEGKFREDLFYRLNTIPINIPPLRERKEEILQIAEKTLAAKCELYGFNEKYFSEEARQTLLHYAWPGNIRELISVCERSAIMSYDNKEVSKKDLFIEEREAYKEKIYELEKQLIIEVLKNHQDLKEASQTLSIEQVELEKKIEKYNIGL